MSLMARLDALRISLMFATHLVDRRGHASKSRAFRQVRNAIACFFVSSLQKNSSISLLGLQKHFKMIYHRHLVMVESDVGNCEVQEFAIHPTNT